MMKSSVAGKSTSALGQCPPGGSGVHAWIMAVANLAAIAGVPQAAAEAEILTAMTRPPSPGSEVASAIRKAYREAAASGGGAHVPRPVKPRPLPHTARAFIEKGRDWGEPEWWEASPVRLDWGPPGFRDAVAVLENLYRPGEYVFCGERFGTEVRTAAEWIDRFKSGAPVPPHWIPNPLTGGEHPLTDGKLSRRGDSAVAAFRYATAEFDGMPRADQLRFWAGYTAAPIVALVDSGGKSIHAILKVDAPNREAWERDIEQGLFGRVLVPLGCDAACRNESRLSRLPGHFRTEKNAPQKLIYLDPEGKARP